MLTGSRFIDAKASLQSRRVVDASTADGNLAGGQFGRALGLARAALMERADSAASGKALLERFDSAVERLSAQSLGTKTVRFDAMGAEGGGLLAGQLRHVQSEILKEKHPVPTAMRLFPADTSVPFGARSYATRRFYEAGEARVHRGGTAEIPRVSLAQAEMEFQVRNYITSTIWDVFEEMSADYANLDYASQLARIARDVLERFANEMTWFGDESYKIYGVLNYPWLDKEVSDLAFGGDPSDTKAYLHALNAYVNRQHHASKGVLGPNKMVTSPRVADWIEQTPMVSSGGMRDRMLGEVFRASSRIQGAIEQAHELEDVMGEGVDAILFYRDDPMGIQNVLPGGGIRTLPLHQTDVERRQIYFMPHGGVRMLEVGNNLLVFVSWVG